MQPLRQARGDRRISGWKENLNVTEVKCKADNHTQEKQAGQPPDRNTDARKLNVGKPRHGFGMDGMFLSFGRLGCVLSMLEACFPAQRRPALEGER
jgi:hypothetical protein